MRVTSPPPRLFLAVELMLTFRNPVPGRKRPSPCSVLRRLAPVGFALAFTVIFSACSQEGNGSAADGASVEVVGFLREVPQDGRGEVLVDHGDIGGFRAAMTSRFPVRDAKEFDGFEAGDPVAFQFVAEEDGAWVERARAIRPDHPGLPLVKENGASPGRSPERLREGDRLPDFALVDQREREIGPKTFSGSPLLLTFIFTRCAAVDFCPRMSGQFAEIRDELNADPSLDAGLRLLSISFDEEDTPGRMAEYGKHFSADPDQWKLATGEREEIENLTEAFSLRIERTDGTIDHSLATALVDSDGVIREIWRGNGWTTEEVLDSLRALHESPANTVAD